MAVLLAIPIKFLLITSFFVSLRHLSLAQDQQNQFIYNGFNGANLLLSGIAKIHSNGLLELTNTSKQEIGRAFFPFPLNFSASSSSNSSRSLSFSSTFVFAMVPELLEFGGHGIAFTFSHSVEFAGAMATQYLGLLNTTTNGLPSDHLFAVELDSAKSPDLDDIDANHVGVDVNSLISEESATVSYFEENEGRNKSLELISGNPIQVWVEYDEVEKLLNVTLAPMGIRKPDRPLLSEILNLSDVFLDSMFVGFSASTGSVASHHYILGWSFNRGGGKAQELDISKLPSLPKSKKRSNFRTKHLLIVVLGLPIMTIFGAVYLMIRRKRYEEVHEEWEKQYGPQRFSYKDLYNATKGFREKELLGAGGFGQVYRGVLQSSKTEIAVKKLLHNSTQGMREFVAEIVSMGRVRHRNLVQLLGYCRRRGELLLVYDYMPNGSLDKFLFGNEEANLNWGHRFRILKGVASGLLYLHEEWEQLVLHRDVKASNVLLDADFNGKLGDFGLCKFYDHGTNPETTRVVGTVGYLAPELTKTGKPTTSSDVYSFGNCMLEIACGRRPYEHQKLPEELLLVDWVLECWKSGDILSTSDPRLKGNYVVEEIELVLKLGLLCTQTTAAARPTMRQIVQYLDGNAKLPELSLDGGAIVITSVTVSNHNSVDYILCSNMSYFDNSAHSCSSSDSILSGR